MSAVGTVRLDPARLVEVAVATNGFDDVGDDDFLDCLAAFCDSVRNEARLNDVGLVESEADVVRQLGNRLRFHRDLHEHPEILDEELLPPIVVAGLPRSGTSKLQRFLSAAPDVQRLEWWRVITPGRLPYQEGEQDPRLEIAAQMETHLSAFPDFLAAHPTSAHTADEDLMLYELTFDAYIAPFRLRIPSFADRVRSRSAAPGYAYVHKLLQYLQWQDGGHRGRSWVLKSPVHTGHLAQLTETYPGATVVQCHRDPRVLIPSFCRLVEVTQRVRCQDIDLELIREQTLDYWSEMTTRNLRDRDAGVDVLDVTFDEITTNIEDVIARTYEKADRHLTAEATAGFARWQAADSYAVGKHTYTYERYGLTREVIEERFAKYLERFFPETAGS
jgi:hypothetical protein